MMVDYACRICAGINRFPVETTVIECEYCGRIQPVPKLDSEKKYKLYERANHHRKNNDYDSAMIVYEKILDEDDTDAETYWLLLLCRYGIEYVKDPLTKKLKPTIHRAQLKPIYADEDYKMAIQYANPYQKTLYEKEAAEIDRILRGILEISKKEQPFDVFICYKETDFHGNRTIDSVIAEELYNELTKSGFQVFFSRITLENKLGEAYEPYIFAALSSAKVMIVLGTKPEYFNATWVKNEWRRFLLLMDTDEGKDKVLIPAYKDMTPYDLPVEFSNLQGQDMSKIGFTIDMIRGIKKILEKDKPQTDSKMQQTYNAAESLLKRGYIFLNGNEWKKADDYFEKTLDINPEIASAYWGKLLCDMRCKTNEDLIIKGIMIDNSKQYQLAVKFANSSEKEEYENVSNIITAKLSGTIEKLNVYLKRYVSENQFVEKYNAFNNQFQKNKERVNQLRDDMIQFDKELKKLNDERTEILAPYYANISDKEKLLMSLRKYLNNMDIEDRKSFKKANIETKLDAAKSDLNLAISSYTSVKNDYRGNVRLSEIRNNNEQIIKEMDTLKIKNNQMIESILQIMGDISDMKEKINKAKKECINGNYSLAENYIGQQQ